MEFIKKVTIKNNGTSNTSSATVIAGGGGAAGINWDGETGTGNAVTGINYDESTKTLSAVKGQTFLTGDDITGKADKATTLSGYGITDAYTKIETDAQILGEILALNVPDSAVDNQFVTAVSERLGEISVSRATLTAANIAQAGKLSNATSGNADTATKLASITDGATNADRKVLVLGADGNIYTSPNVTSNFAQGSIKGKKVQITDGTNTATLTINDNGIYVDKPIICQGDVVAYGVPTTEVDSVQDMIVNYINEHKGEFGSIDNVVIATATGDGNVITGLSAALSDDKRTITITPTKGITALTSHQDISGKVNKSGDTMTGALKFGNDNHSISGNTDMVIRANGGWMYILAKNKIYNKVGDNGKSFQIGSDSLTWDSKNIAVTDDITNAVNALDVADTAVDNKFVTAVSETNGKISVSRATLTAANIAQAGKLSNATSGKADTAGLSDMLVRHDYSSGSSWDLAWWGNNNTVYATPGVTITPNTKTITATTFAGNATTATNLASTSIMSGHAGNLTPYGSSLGWYKIARLRFLQGCRFTIFIQGKAGQNGNNDGRFGIVTISANYLNMFGGTVRVMRGYDDGSIGDFYIVYDSGLSGAATLYLRNGSAYEAFDYFSVCSGVERDYIDLFNNTYVSTSPLTTDANGNPSNYVKLNEYTVAYNVDNVASATKLQTARTIWGQSFNGTADVNGYVIINNDYGVEGKDTGGTARTLLTLNSSNQVNLGYGTAGAGYDTYINGNNTIFRLGTGHSEKMRITADGKMGVGTTSPQQRLHVSGASRTKYVDFYSKDGETTRAGWVGRGSDANDNLTLYSDNAAINIDSNAEINLKAVHKQVVKAGYDATALQSWACIGEASTNCKVSNLNFSVNGYESKARLQFIDNGNFYMGRNYETTISNDNAAVRIPVSGGLVLSSTAALSGTRDNAIYIRPLGSNSTTNQVKFESDGVTISASSANGLVIKRTVANAGAFVNYFNCNQSNNAWRVGMNNDNKFAWTYSTDGLSSGTTELTLDTAGNLVARGDVTAYSDRRLKSDIKDLEFRGSLEPKEYVKDGKKCVGFIAQEVRELYPELVLGEESENSYLSLNYGAITAVLAAENKELHKKVESLEERIEKLETLINKLIEK